MDAEKKVTLEDVPRILIQIQADIELLKDLQKPQPTTTNRIMRHDEAAKYTGLSKSRLYQTNAPCHKQGGTRFYLESELREWILSK